MLLSNIWKIYFLKASRWFLLTMAIMIPFYESHHISMQEIFWLQSVFSIVLVMLEVPSGYMSDVIGRKLTLILGSIFGIIGYGIYAFSSGFFGFLMAEILLACGASCISGTDSALLYDSLKHLGREREHKKIAGNIQAIGSFSEAIASLLGGWLAVVSLDLPFLVQFCILVVTFPVVLFLHEPPGERHTNHEGAIKGMLRIIRYSTHEHREVRSFLLLTGFLGLRRCFLPGWHRSTLLI